MRSPFWLVALALYLLFALVFLQARRTQPRPPLPAPYVLSRVDSSAHVLLETAHFTGVLLAPPAAYRSEDVIPIVLLAEQVLVAEAVLAQCVASGNTGGNDPDPRIFCIYPGMLRPLGDYYRQYRGYRTPNGHTIVWINALTKTVATDWRLDWQRQEVHVQDGGDDFFHISIDLTTQQCFYFVRNSIGG